jgi:hypothetical protein
MVGMPVVFDVVTKLAFQRSKDLATVPAQDRIEGALMQAHKNRIAYRFAMGIAVVAACLLIWLSLGVGIIGKDGDSANMMYFGVIAVGIIGAIISRFRPMGMARILLAMALAQALVALIALIAGLGLPWSGPAEIIMLNGIFIGMFIGSAWLFKRTVANQ